MLPTTTEKFTPGHNEWLPIFGCLDDPAACLFVVFCPCCAVCSIGYEMQDFPVGPLNEPAQDFMSCTGMSYNFLTYCCLGKCASCSFFLWGFFCGIMCCPDKTMCCYDLNMLEAVARYKEKKTISPGPCTEPLLQAWCCASCTLCVLYRGECDGPQTP